MLRAMTTHDVPRCFEVRTATLENALTMEQLEEWYDLTPDSLTKSMGDTLRGWVFEDGGVIVGFAMGDSTDGELTVIAVLPGHEGRGVGKVLLEAVTRWLLGEGCPELWLVTTANPDLRAYGFYLSQGWRATGEIDEDDEERFVYAGEP